MKNLRPATVDVIPNEPAYNLSEVNLQSPGSRGWHRYQVITVVRNDRLADCMIDMGPRKNFKVGEFRIPGGVVDEKTGRIEILHTVDELRGIANHLRFEPLNTMVKKTDILDRYARKRGL